MNEFGNKVEGETRMCVHCQYSWQYKQGSGRRFGVCGTCNGLICARPECFALQKQMLKEIEREDLHCIDYTEYTYLLKEKLDFAISKFGAHGEGFSVSEGGLIIPQ